MNKQKEIEKMAEIICEAYIPKQKPQELRYADIYRFMPVAEALFDAGYRGMDDYRIMEMQLKSGEIDMKLSSDYFKIFMYSIVQTFKQNGSKNFLATTIDMNDESGEKYSIIIQKVNGKTPQEELSALRNNSGDVKQAVREFAERLKERLVSEVCICGYSQEEVDYQIEECIDELVKEVCGE